MSKGTRVFWAWPYRVRDRGRQLAHDPRDGVYWVYEYTARRFGIGRATTVLIDELLLARELDTRRLVRDEIMRNGRVAS